MEQVKYIQTEQIVEDDSPIVGEKAVTFFVDEMGFIQYASEYQEDENIENQIA